MVSYYLDTNYADDDAKTAIGARFCITSLLLSSARASYSTSRATQSTSIIQPSFKSHLQLQNQHIHFNQLQELSCVLKIKLKNFCPFLQVLLFDHYTSLCTFSPSSPSQSSHHLNTGLNRGLLPAASPGPPAPWWPPLKVIQGPLSVHEDIQFGNA